MRSAVALIAVAAAALAGVALVPGTPAAKSGSCPVFPSTWSTNQRVDGLPVAERSDAIVRSIGLDDGFHADFGSGRYAGHRIGIPVTTVDGSEVRRSKVRFDYADESDRVRYPIPAKVRIEGGSDRHAVIVDRRSCRLYELFALRRSGGRWQAGSGATWSLRRPRLRPAGWTSADAAGLPIYPLLARYADVRKGRIRHALRVTVARSRDAYVRPARHAASDESDPALPRMGERLRLKRSVDVSRFSRQARIVARAMQEYGLIVADNGSDWYVSGAPDEHWDNDALHELDVITGRDFEVVDAP